MNEKGIAELEGLARELRFLILKTTHTAGAGHTGGSLSMVEILTSLYFHIMNIDPEDPSMEDRDRFILSKGHSTPGYYSALALRGYFPESELASFDRIDSRLQAHPDMNKCPGVDYSTGSLGQGLSIGIGMALGGQAAGKKFNTFVLLGDGESQEGQVWEAAMYGGAHKVRNIIAMVDYNKVQLAARTADTLDLYPLDQKWKAFNWSVLQCDGNNMTELLKTLKEAVEMSREGPVVLLAHTIKGKGISFMEDSFEWHGKAANAEEYRNALEELSYQDREWV
jgi:transketolase